jgi:hypothetical protein
MSSELLTMDEVTDLIESELGELSPHENSLFKSISVPVNAVTINLRGSNETVFVVAKSHDQIVFHDPIEGGFDIGIINKSNGIVCNSANQYEIQHVIHQIFAL